MSEFKKYDKIHRLGKEETEGILDGFCHIQEKVDGANTQIWFDAESNWIKCGSRSKEVKEGFNGFVDYVHKHEGIKRLLTENPSWRLYGEWLVRHTIAYKETAYRKWYMFDILTPDGFMAHNGIRTIGEEYGVETVPYRGGILNPTLEKINEFVGKTEFGDRGEGVVIKNLNFKNKFGDTVYAKIVTESFKEDNAVVFGGNNKHSETYWEVYVVNKYMTLPRVQKIMNKLQPEINEKLDMKDIPRVCGTALHDMMTEEIWSIVKDVPKLDLKALQRIAFKKARQIFIDVIHSDISVADKNNEPKA